MGQFIKLTVQSLTLEIFQTSGSCAICVTKVIFSGYEKLQVDTYLIPPGKTKLNERYREVDILLFQRVNFCGYINFRVMWILFCFTYCVNTECLIDVILVYVGW